MRIEWRLAANSGPVLPFHLLPLEEISNLPLIFSCFSTFAEGERMINTKVRFTKGRIIDRNNNKEINFAYSSQESISKSSR